MVVACVAVLRFVASNSVVQISKVGNRCLMLLMLHGACYQNLNLNISRFRLGKRNLISEIIMKSTMLPNDL